MYPPTTVLVSVSSSRISFPALTTTKWKFNGLNPKGVNRAVPVQLALSVYVPVNGAVTILPFTSKVPAPETFPAAGRPNWWLARLRHIALDKRVPDHHRQRFHLGNQLEHRGRCHAERATSRGLQPQECHCQWRGHRPGHLRQSGSGGGGFPPRVAGRIRRPQQRHGRRHVQHRYRGEQGLLSG